MPVGMVVMKWDERIGAEILTKYPDELIIQDKTLMQIYSTHEYNQEAGMISLMAGAGARTIASYYTGPEHSLYTILVLSTEEDPDVFEEGLADASRMIVQNLEGEAFKAIIPSLFQRVSTYPSLDPSQKLMMLFLDEIKRMLLKRLQEEGSVLKSEVSIWLKDRFQTDFVDLDSIITSFIKTGLIKEASVKGVVSETLFLINDLIIYRIPAVDILKDPQDRGLPTAELAKNYISECKIFFQNYVPNEEDNLVMIDILLEPQIYETVKLLRAAVVRRDDIEKLRKKGVEDIEYVLKKLWDGNFLVVSQDESGNEYFALKSDIKVKQYFPEYLVNTIRRDFNDNVKNPKVIIEHLNILEDTYIEQ
ncbi:MAG: hypothetical protein ACTSWY_05335 [Promethearchaeota archaeon]